MVLQMVTRNAIQLALFAKPNGKTMSRRRTATRNTSDKSFKNGRKKKRVIFFRKY